MESALQIPEDHDRELCLTKLRVGDLAYRRGQFEAAVKNYRSARTVADRLKNEKLISIASIKIAISLSGMDRLDEASQNLEQALSIQDANHILNANEAALLHHELSILLFRLDRFAEGRREEEQALKLLHEETLPDKELSALVLKQLGIYASKDGNFKAAEEYLNEAEGLILSSGGPGKDSLAYGQLLASRAILLIDMKRFEEARELYDRAVTLIELREGQFNSKVAQLFRLFAHHLEAAGQGEESRNFNARADAVDQHNKNHASSW